MIAVIIFSAALWTQAEAAALADVALFAHRGVVSDAPENSLAALDAAWQAGLHGAEIDLRTTADNVLVLMHDETLMRTTNGTGCVEAISWDQLNALRLKNPEGTLTAYHPPRLEQALAWAVLHPGFRLALDIKTADVTKVGKAVLAHGLENRTDLYVGGIENAGRIRQIKAFSPDLRVSFNPEWWWGVEGVAAFAARAAGADALFAPEWYFPQRGFAEAQKAGAEVQVYLWGRKDLKQRFKKAVALGAQVVSCDDPLQLLPLVTARDEDAETSQQKTGQMQQ